MPRIRGFNAYQSSIPGGVNDSVLVIPVVTEGNIEEQSYVVLSHEDNALREYVKVISVAPGELTVEARGLEGSANFPLGSTHPPDATVRTVAVHQWLDDIFDDIEANALAISTHIAAADPHPQYVTDAEADAAYLRLDATNDPVTSLLTVNDLIVGGALSVVGQTDVDVLVAAGLATFDAGVDVGNTFIEFETGFSISSIGGAFLQFFAGGAQSMLLQRIPTTEQTKMVVLGSTTDDDQGAQLQYGGGAASSAAILWDRFADRLDLKFDAATPISIEQLKTTFNQSVDLFGLLDVSQAQSSLWFVEEGGKIEFRTDSVLDRVQLSASDQELDIDLKDGSSLFGMRFSRDNAEGQVVASIGSTSANANKGGRLEIGGPTTDPLTPAVVEYVRPSGSDPRLDVYLDGGTDKVFEINERGITQAADVDQNFEEFGQRGMWTQEWSVTPGVAPSGAIDAASFRCAIAINPTTKQIWYDDRVIGAGTPAWTLLGTLL